MVAAETKGEVLQQARWQVRSGAAVASRPFVAGNVQRHADRIHGGGVGIVDLAGLQVGDARLGQVRAPRQTVLRQALNAALLANEPPEKDAEGR